MRKGIFLPRGTEPWHGGVARGIILLCFFLLQINKSAPGITPWQVKITSVPVLCYHNINNQKLQASPYNISYQQFYNHMKMLHDSGFHCITPQQLYIHYISGMSLPERPVIISFDDNRIEHFKIAAPVLEEFGFKGTFFIMTVTIGKKGYMNRSELKKLKEEGHAIEHHTYDHQLLTRLDDKGWNEQIVQPKNKLEKIIDHSVQYLAYPNGAWDEEVIRKLKGSGIKAAFQLSAKQSASEPLFTIRRIIVPGTWLSGTLFQHIRRDF